MDTITRRRQGSRTVAMGFYDDTKTQKLHNVQGLLYLRMHTRVYVYTGMCTSRLLPAQLSYCQTVTRIRTPTVDHSCRACNFNVEPARIKNEHRISGHECTRCSNNLPSKFIRVCIKVLAAAPGYLELDYF